MRTSVRVVDVVSRERLAALVAQDLSSRQIAAALGCSQSRVQALLRRHGLRTTAAARGRRARLERLEAVCAAHGEGEHVVDRTGTVRCLACRRAAVVEHRRRTKRRLLEEFGGRCVLCGFDAFPAALQFHHRRPEEKRFGIAHGGMSRSYEALREEASRCVVLCANCHAGVEAGALRLGPDDGSSPERIRTSKN